MNTSYLRLNLRELVVLIAMIASADAAEKSGPAADKSRYHLFNPVPAELMRPMSTDRPDRTESPFTVDAGHVQIEMDIANWTRDRSDDSFIFGGTNLKFGLLHNVDIQFVFGGHQSIEDGTDGVGDLETRLKINLWGNDGGKTAFAVMPFVKWPTASDGVGDNDSIEGGVIFPLAIELSESVGLGLMYEIDILKDSDGSGYHADHVATATVGFDLTEKLGMYLEAAAEFPSKKEGDFAAIASVGWTFSPTENLQWDLGANFGLNNAAPDFDPFLGLSVRF
jgi:hypothetical protein